MAIKPKLYDSIFIPYTRENVCKYFIKLSGNVYIDPASILMDEDKDKCAEMSCLPNTLE